MFAGEGSDHLNPHGERPGRDHRGVRHVRWRFRVRAHPPAARISAHGGASGGRRRTTGRERTHAHPGPLRDGVLITPLGMSIISPGRHMLQVNPALCRILGRSADDLLGMHADEFTTATTSAHSQHDRLLAGEIDDYEVEKRFLRPDGAVVWAALHVAAVRDEQGRALSLVSQVHDITDQVAAREQLSWSASHDALTGLASRGRLLFDVGSRKVASARRGSSDVAQDRPGLHRPRRLQAGQRHPGPPGGRPAADRGRPSGSAGSYAPATPWPGSAATSSWCTWPRCPGPRTCARSAR